MRLERHQDAGPVGRLRPRRDLAKHRHVPQVHAIERADRHDGAGIRQRQRDGHAASSTTRGCQRSSRRSATAIRLVSVHQGRFGSFAGFAPLDLFDCHRADRAACRGLGVTQHPPPHPAQQRERRDQRHSPTSCAAGSRHRRGRDRWIRAGARCSAPPNPAARPGHARGHGCRCPPIPRLRSRRPVAHHRDQLQRGDRHFAGLKLGNAARARDLVGRASQPPSAPSRPAGAGDRSLRAPGAPSVRPAHRARPPAPAPRRPRRSSHRCRSPPPRSRRRDSAWSALHEARQPGRVSHEDDEQPGRERVERSGMAHRADIERAPDPGHYVVGREAGRFVNEQTARQAAILPREARRTARSSAARARLRGPARNGAPARCGSRACWPRGSAEIRLALSSPSTARSAVDAFAEHHVDPRVSEIAGDLDAGDRDPGNPGITHVLRQGRRHDLTDRFGHLLGPMGRLLLHRTLTHSRSRTTPACA